MSFFEDLFSFVSEKENSGQKLYIDLAAVENLTIDALMYLIALMKNRRNDYNANKSFKGNYPVLSNINELIHCSGFDRYVLYNGIQTGNARIECIPITTGEKVDTAFAKNVCDFIIEKGNTTKKACKFLYNMMIELMANVYAHAYGEADSILCSRWYCFAEYDASNNMIDFTFMDTGDGIPSTVQKHGLEQFDFLKMKGDGSYVISALKGELRSKTGIPYRGKGLPKVFSYCESNQIKNMRIISNKADITIEGSTITPIELQIPLMGTLFWWRIDLLSLQLVATT